MSGVRGFAERGVRGHSGRHAGRDGPRSNVAQRADRQRHVNVGLAGRLLPGDVFSAGVLRPTIPVV